MNFSHYEYETLNMFFRVKPHITKTSGPSPHKPLLLIWMVSLCIQDEINNKTFDSRLLPFNQYREEIEPQIRNLLDQKSKIKIEYPYWRLQNDNVWDVRTDSPEKYALNADPPIPFLNKSEAGLSESIYRVIRNNTNLGHEIIFQLLDQFIPEYLHIDILTETIPSNQFSGSSMGEGQGYFQSYYRRLRDYKFRKEVLPEYQYMCAVCNLSIKFNNQFPALEAAHIKAVQHNGPNIVSNGLSLCSNHHALFDRGTFTIVPILKKLIVEVSANVEDEGVNKLLIPYNSCPIILPKNHLNNPKSEYLEWHREHVFKAE